MHPDELNRGVNAGVQLLNLTRMRENNVAVSEANNALFSEPFSEPFSELFLAHPKADWFIKAGSGRT